MTEAAYHIPLQPGVREPTNEYGERWQTPEPLKPTTWATEPPDGTPLTEAERRVREQLEDRRRAGEARVAAQGEAVRAAQRTREAAIAREFGMSEGALAEFVAPHVPTLEPLHSRVASAQRTLDRAIEGQRRAVTLLEEKAAALKRFSDADQAAAERFAADCEASLLSGEPANPYQDWSVEDAVAQRRAEVEHRGAKQAVERFAGIIANARQALEAAQHALRQAVDSILAEHHGRPLLERYRAVLDEAERMRVELQGFRGVDMRGCLPMAGLDFSLDERVTGASVQTSVEGALYAWRQRREALIAGKLPGPQTASA